MIRLLSIFALFPLALFSAPTAGQVEVRIYGSGGYTTYPVTWANGQIIMKSGGVPVAQTLDKAAVGLGNVENTALSTYAGTANVTTLGTITTGVWHGTDIGLDYIAGGGATDGQILAWSDPTGWAPVTLGLTVGTTSISGGTSGRLLYDNAGVVGEMALGANVATLLSTPSSANLASALTDETGSGAAVFGTAPTFTGSIVVNKAGQSEAGGIEVADDVGNTSVRALYLLPPANSTRIYLGKPGQSVYALDLSYCLYFTSVPEFSTINGLKVGGNGNTNIQRSYDGGTEIGANHPAGYGLDILQDNSFANTGLTHLAMNVHRTNGTTIYGTVTTRTNYEGLNLSWDGTQYLIKPVAGSGGGTVRPVRYHTTGSVFLASGSGSPEGVVTAAVGSIYTRTDGGAGTTLYVKESGTGNTGWVAK